MIYDVVLWMYFEILILCGVVWYKVMVKCVEWYVDVIVVDIYVVVD